MRTISVKLLLCTILFYFAACKKEESSNPVAVVSKDTKFSLTIDGSSDIYADKSVVKLGVSTKFSDEIKSLKLSFSESIDFKSPIYILDTTYNEGQKELEINQSYTLKRYASNKLWFRLQITDLQDSVFTKDTFISYHNVIYKENDVDLSYSGWQCSRVGYNFTEMKGKYIGCTANDPKIIEFDVLYAEPNGNNKDVILSKGEDNKTKYSFIDFGNTPDSLISTDLVESKLLSLTFSETLNFGTYLSKSKWVVLKLDKNKYNKPWALMKVWYLTSYSKTGSNTWVGRIKGTTYDYPTNY
jgi:hypothetical protein